MAVWSKEKVNPSSINSGNEYTIVDQVPIEQLNSITNNSFYASDVVDTLDGGDFNIETTYKYPNLVRYSVDGCLYMAVYKVGDTYTVFSGELPTNTTYWSKKVSNTGNTAPVVTAFSETPSDTDVPSEKLVKNSLTKQFIGLGNVYNPTAYGGISYGGGSGESGVSFTDLNSLTYTGFYTCYGTTANVPSASYSWYIQHINSNVANVSATQIATAYGADHIIYKRNKTANTWGAWENISPSLKANLSGAEFTGDVNVTTGNTFKINDVDIVSNIAQYETIEEVSSFNVGGGQGIAFDGTYIYSSNNTMLYKYNLSGTLITSRDISGDGTATSHLGDIFVKDGVIYGACANYPYTPYQAYIGKWNTTDLSWIGEHNISTVAHSSTLAYANGYWWFILYQANQVMQLDDTFTEIETYDIPFTFLSGDYFWDGMFWVGNEMFLNTHEGVVYEGVHQFHWDGAKFTHIRILDRPTECTQGMDIDTTTGDIWLVRRTTQNQAVKARLEVRKPLLQTIAITSVSGDNFSTSSTSYVEDTTCKTQIYARKGDIIEATLDGLFRVSGHHMKAYLEASSDNATSISVISNYGSLRSNFLAAENDYKYYSRLFKVNSNGWVKISNYVRIETSGTAYISNESIVLRIVGRV